MSKKHAFLKKVTIVSGTVLALSSLTGCFGKEEVVSKEKNQKKTEEVKKDKKTETTKKEEETGQKQEVSEPEVDDTTSVTKKDAMPVVSTNTAKKYLTEEETKQLTTILQTNQKTKVEQEKLPAPAIEPPKIEPSPPVILTPLGNTPNAKESISIEKPMPSTDMEKPKVTVELPKEPDKPKQPVVIPPIGDGEGDKPKPPVIDEGEKPKPPVIDPPKEPEKPVDKEAPKLTAKENRTVQKGQNLNPHDLVTVTDNRDNNPLLSINGTYNTSQEGNIQVEVVAIDQAGNRSSIKVTVTVIDPEADKDREAPVIKPKENIIVPVGHILSAQDVVTVSDNKDANPIVSVGKYDTSKAGEIQVEVIAVDRSGNQASVMVTVKVIDVKENKDTEAPVIKPKENVTVKVGAKVLPQDLVTVQDNQDANPIVTIGAYDTSKAGDISVEVMAADQAGNRSVTKVGVKVVEEPKQYPPATPPVEKQQPEEEKPAQTERTPNDKETGDMS
ncbi:hypothetical protein [Bacillus cereus]|uniref:Cadherin domain-containing protein n=1 Tax=Bacillus cereus TaxID=1396 RepID=A0AAW5L816_BACCE|nr:hypothetical protein [Bacillus cereus]MCQ6288524.1 hypothetical protein [Bacillus cereus]MCQ6304900.1 hypothetical protein [Bacillus cereus]MCQ6317649.1 hypothetical protein [Bacillus cereus]MCQ6329009.1 hypothetical protein [Bacillus cereus]MCQ6385633.1 hypothetical protein [Bacillus cereus]